MNRPFPHPSTRYLGRVIAAALCTALTVTMAACGAESDQENVPETSTSNASAEEGYYPHTQHTAHGDTTIDSSPQRVLALTPTAADELLALGITPTAVAADPTTLDTTAPWIADKIRDISDATIAPERSLNVEAVAKIDPDLAIGASWQFQDATLWKRLNDIAPTVIPQAADANVGWETSLRTTAEAVGRSARAEEIIAEVTKEFSDAAGNVPKDTTYNFTGYSEALGFFPGNGSVFKLFGLVPATSQDDTQNSASLSTENIDKLNGDLLAIWPQSPADRTELDQNPSFQRLPAVAKGTVYYADERDANAINAAGPHSLRWFLDRITPIIGKFQ